MDHARPGPAGGHDPEHAAAEQHAGDQLPSTAGCPIRSASSPSSLAADQDGGQHEEEPRDVDPPPRRRAESCCEDGERDERDAALD